MARTAGQGEWARHWRYERLPGLDLLRARYVRHTFPRHSHDGFVIGAVTRGVEAVGLADGTLHAGPGSVVLLNPEVAHTARAGGPDGWAYATLYPSADVVAEIAAETGTVRGTAVFGEPIVTDPGASQMINEVHRAAEEGNALAADSLLRVVLARLLRAHGSSSRRGPGGPRGPRPRTARAKSSKSVWRTRRPWKPSRPSSAPAPSRCCGPSATRTGCRRTPGSPTRGCAWHGGSWRRGRRPPMPL